MGDVTHFTSGLCMALTLSLTVNNINNYTHHKEQFYQLIAVYKYSTATANCNFLLQAPQNQLRGRLQNTERDSQNLHLYNTVTIQ